MTAVNCASTRNACGVIGNVVGICGYCAAIHLNDRGVVVQGAAFNGECAVLGGNGRWRIGRQRAVGKLRNGRTVPRMKRPATVIGYISGQCGVCYSHNARGHFNAAAVPRGMVVTDVAACGDKRPLKVINAAAAKIIDAIAIKPNRIGRVIANETGCVRDKGRAAHDIDACAIRGRVADDICAIDGDMGVGINQHPGAPVGTVAANFTAVEGGTAIHNHNTAAGEGGVWCRDGIADNFAAVHGKGGCAAVDINAAAAVALAGYGCCGRVVLVDSPTFQGHGSPIDVDTTALVGCVADDAAVLQCHTAILHVDAAAIIGCGVVVDGDVVENGRCASQNI